jgi:hypothetical protein
MFFSGAMSTVTGPPFEVGNSGKEFQHTTLVSVYASPEEFRVRQRSFAILLPVLISAATCVPLGHASRRMPLAAADVEAITRLVMIEDTRRFDEAALTPLLQSKHPDVRRRVVLTIGRIADRGN